MFNFRSKSKSKEVCELFLKSALSKEGNISGSACRCAWCNACTDCYQGNSISNYDFQGFRHYVKDLVCQLKEENEKLKAENELLAGQTDNFLKCSWGIINQRKKLEQENQLLKKTLNRELCEDGGIVDVMLKDQHKLTSKIEQLKAQLQNRDKASQVEHCQVSGVKLDKVNHNSHSLREAYECISCNPERKPRVCRYCFSFMSNCAVCNGTGLVWEPAQ